MKQIIVLAATIVLGLAIATMVIGFKNDAENLSEIAHDGINRITSTTAINLGN